MFIEQAKQDRHKRQGVRGRLDGRWRLCEHVAAGHDRPQTFVSPHHCIMQLHDGYGRAAPQVIALARLEPEPAQR